METFLPYDTILEAESVAVLGLGLVITLLLLYFQQRSYNRNTTSILTVVERQTDNHTKQIEAMNTTNRMIGELEHRIEKETDLLIAHDVGAITRQGAIMGKLSEIHQIVSSIKLAVETVEHHIVSIEKDAK